MGTIIIEIPEQIDLKIQASNISQAVDELNKYVNIMNDNGYQDIVAINTV